MKYLMPLLLALAGCAAPPEPAPAPRDGLLPGSIGVALEREPSGLVVAALRADGAAAGAGVRAGDLVLRYNGTPVSTLRDFNRLVADSPPGSIARVELLRDGRLLQLEMPVRELDTMPRV
jgi:S1-C subfamily serine protease